MAGSLNNNSSQASLNNQFLLSSVKEDASLLQDADIVNAYNNLSGSNTEKIYNTRIFFNNKQISLANAENGSILPTNTIEQNAKLVGEILINHQTIDSILNDTELQVLRNIAILCPYTEGASVYEARSILSLYDTIQYANECEIISPQVSSARLRSGVEKNNETLMQENFSDYKAEIVISPNPAQDDLNVFIRNIEDISSLKIQILDLEGRIILSNSFFRNSNNKISIKEILPGAYYCRILLNDEIKETKKLIIIK